MKPDLFWIPGPWRGKLAVVTRPRGGDWLQDETAGWKRAGLDVVVSLLEAEESAMLGLEREAEEAARQGVRFHSFPMPDRGVPSSQSEALQRLRQIERDLEQGLTVAVHCRQSIGRAGMTAAALLVRAGSTVEQAVASVSAARGIQVPETPIQLRWLQSLPAAQPIATH